MSNNYSHCSTLSTVLIPLKSDLLKSEEIKKNLAKVGNEIDWLYCV